MNNEETKTCRRCGETKLLTEFEINRKFASGTIARRAYCIECGKKQKPIKHSVRKQYIRPDKLECPLCKVVVSGNRNIVLDHNHDTGHVRGWICDNCNTGMGRAMDSIDIMERWIEWIRDNGNNQTTRLPV